MSTPHPKVGSTLKPKTTKGPSGGEIYGNIGLGSASSTEYSSLLESASGKAAQNDASIAAAKALQEATTKDSDEKIIHLHEVMQLELKAQS